MQHHRFQYHTTHELYLRFQYIESLLTNRSVYRLSWMISCFLIIVFYLYLYPKWIGLMYFVWFSIGAALVLLLPSISWPENFMLVSIYWIVTWYADPNELTTKRSTDPPCINLKRIKTSVLLKWIFLNKTKFMVMSDCGWGNLAI